MHDTYVVSVHRLHQLSGVQPLVICAVDTQHIVPGTVVDVHWLTVGRLLKVCPHCEPLYGATAVPKYEHVLAPQPVVAAGGGAGAQCAYVMHAEHPEGALAHAGSECGPQSAQPPEFPGGCNQ